MWFKEYIFNLIIQPFHLILYAVLVGAALSLASESLIYAVVAIYFVTPAEKLLRKFFGFDNAGTLSAAGSFAGGALFSAMINKMNRPKPQDKDDGEDKGKNTRRTSHGVTDPTREIFGRTMNGTGGGRKSEDGGSGGRRWCWRTAVAKAEVILGGQDGRYCSKWNRYRRKSADKAEFLYGGFAGDDFGDVIPGLREDALWTEKTGARTKWDIMKNGFGRRIGDSTRSMAYNAKHRAITGIKKMPKKAGRFVRRAGIGALTGGAAGLAALGAGAAMDPSKALALTATAASAGANFGNFYGDKFAKTSGAITEGGKQAFWGKDYKAIQQAKFDKEFMRDPATIDALTKSLGSRDAAIKAIESGDVQAFLNSNHTDPSKIGKALGKKEAYVKAAQDKAVKDAMEKAKKERRKFTRDDKLKALEKGEAQGLQRSIAMATWARDIHPGVFNPNSREQVAWKTTLTKQLEAEGMSESDATKRVNDILAELEYINS